MPDVDVHPSLDELEVHLRHLPGRGEPEELLEYFDVLHPPSEPPLRRLVKRYPRDSRKGQLIPRVSTAILTLGAAACGEDGGGKGGSDLSTPAGMAEAFCAYEYECDREGFSYDYESLDDCVATLTEELEVAFDYYREVYGAACADAIVDYYRCYVEFYEDIEACMLPSEADPCPTESAVMDEACYF